LRNGLPERRRTSRARSGNDRVAATAVDMKDLPS
jgi:hypothetical protein